MYNKIFHKILDSSIWLEPTPTRIVWITLIAAMDQDGFAHFSALENLAGRARVTVDEAKEAVECFLAPDPNSANPANEGRRIERVPGGYMILNASEHRQTVNRIIQREQTRERVAKHRAKQRYTTVTEVLPTVTTRPYTEAEAYTETEAVKTLASSAKIALSANGLWENISVEIRSAWERAHPAVNLDTELAKAAAWILANPKNVKKNYAKFLTNWLARSQDRAPRVNQAISGQTTGKIGRALEACKKAYAT
jgi:hypothetical protein